MYLCTGLDIRVGFNDCIILIWLTSYFEMKVNKIINILEVTTNTEFVPKSFGSRTFLKISGVS